MPEQSEMTSENLDNLVHNACFAADLAAMEARYTLKGTNAEITRATVKRAIEFLVGNGLLEFKKDGTGEWLSVDPPYPCLTDADNGGS